MAAPFAFSMALSTRSRQVSTVVTACMAASRMPVWPTMSGLAKLHIAASYWLDAMASVNRSAISGALISGLWS